jgi:hypothetical protein
MKVDKNFFYCFKCGKTREGIYKGVSMVDGKSILICPICRTERKVGKIIRTHDRKGDFGDFE